LNKTDRQNLSKSASGVPVLPTASPMCHQETPKAAKNTKSAKSLRGARWHQPAFNISMLLMGLTFALGHHFYYLSLDGQSAGDVAKQAWPIRFGTAFAFLAVSFFEAATASAFAQYIWLVVRKIPLTICKSSLPMNHEGLHESISVQGCSKSAGYFSNSSYPRVIGLTFVEIFFHTT